jgi:uncharacterized membrane protein (DUF441 family)
MRLRWYYYFSFWTLFLCTTYRIHGFNTYPLLLFCLLGLIAIPLIPSTELVTVQYIKIFLLLTVHLMPFLWIPALINQAGIQFGLYVLIVYILFMIVLNKNIVTAYLEAIYKPHTSTFAFLKEGLGL